jgi:hypothetical protein
VRPGQRAPATTKQILAAELRLREAQDRKQQINDIWRRLNQVVDERGGSITSPPFCWPVRLEVFPESGLPARLSTLGYIVVSRGQITRIGPPRTKWNAEPFRVMDAFDVDLAGGR